jgi:hypothetical protein
MDEKSKEQMLSTSGVLISVCDDPGQCPICGSTAWRVQKSVTHHGKTITHGQFEIRETVHVCSAGCRFESGRFVTRRASSLTEHIIPGRVIGYDVMAFVGIERFIHHRQREDIRSSLFNKHGISLSTGEISNLAMLFLSYLRDLHNRHTEQLRSALAADGGWPLHIDATCEDGRGTLLVALAGWRQWVLGAWKVPTERSEAIVPCLGEVVLRFGPPCAVMRDLGRGITLAVKTLISELHLNIPVLACHYHFLQDIGNDLLKPAHTELGYLFRRTKIKPKLRALSRELGRKIGVHIAQARENVKAWQEQPDTDLVLPQGKAGIATLRAFSQWVIDFHAESSNLDFPFTRPYLDFYDRSKTALRAAGNFLRVKSTDEKVLKLLKRFEHILQPVASEVPFRRIAARLNSRAKLFDELRDSLRLFPERSSAAQIENVPLPPEQQAQELQDIREELDKLILSLKTRRPKRGPAQDARNAIDTLLTHIERHGDSLWGHAIPLPDNIGGGIGVVQRTNNILEGFFKGMKHDERRRSGRKNLTHDFETLPPAAALAYNLNRPDYVSIVCGSLECLHKAFAKLDSDKANGITSNEEKVSVSALQSAAQTETSSLPSEDRRLVRTEHMKRRILAAARG